MTQFYDVFLDADEHDEDGSKEPQTVDHGRIRESSE
jgi:hypothetical protein